jgi:hypothetical protein
VKAGHTRDNLAENYYSGGNAVIDQKDFLHGAALVAIADSGQFTALNKAEGYGHYVVNHNRHVFIKHTAMPGTEFRFTFNQDDVRRLRATADHSQTFAIFVCERVAIAGLSIEDLGEIIDLDSTSTQWLKITGEPNKSLRICGSSGQLQRLVPRSEFPEPILG